MNFEEFKNKYQKTEVEHYPNNVPKSPLVSICVFTFQHKEYIKKCLDGVLMQKVDFPVEIIVGEDASTDGTREICIEYAKKHPEKIRLLLHSRDNNIKVNNSPTGRFNVLYGYHSANGKYIAICEGDDYWTDPMKLQEQVKTMEMHSEMAICTHEAHHRVLNDSDFHTIRRAASILIRDFQLFGVKSLPILCYYLLFDQKKFWFRKRTNDGLKRRRFNYLKDFKDGGLYMPTCSVLVKREVAIKLKDCLEGDTGGHHALLLLGTLHGGIYHIPKIMAVKQDQESSVSKDSKRLAIIREANRKIGTNNKINRYRNLKKIADKEQAKLLDEMITKHIKKQGLVE